MWEAGASVTAAGRDDDAAGDARGASGNAAAWLMLTTSKIDDGGPAGEGDGCGCCRGDRRGSSASGAGDARGGDRPAGPLAEPAGALAAEGDGLSEVGMMVAFFLGGKNAKQTAKQAPEAREQKKHALPPSSPCRLSNPQPPSPSPSRHSSLSLCHPMHAPLPSPAPARRLPNCGRHTPRRPPPPAARRVRDDTNWRDVLASKFNRPTEDAEFTFVPDGEGEDASASSSEVVEDLFTVDGGWRVDLLEGDDDDNDDDDDGPQSWTAGPEFPGPPPTTRRALTTPASPTSGLDIDALPPSSALGSIPRHLLTRLMAAQDAAASEPPARSPRDKARDRKTHTLLTIQGGAARGVKLRSGRGDTTRPMMAKVKAALFDMLTSGSPAGPGELPPGATWLDLFAGTGSVGLEAVSRGAARADFVEMDPSVVSSVLQPNAAAVAEAADIDASATTRMHTATAQAFLERHAGPAYDYVSVCPPYVKVEYGELLDAVAASSVLHPHSVVIVEYPSRAAGRLPIQLGGLVRLRDRRYGRTNVAVYGPGE